MRNFILVLVFLLSSLTLFLTTGRPRRPAVENERFDVPASLETADDPHAQAEMEFLMLRDPRANAIPENIMEEERRLARSLPRREDGALGKAGGEQVSVTWVERGPDNIGGRSRVFAADIATPGVLIAGSVAGGIWRTTNDGTSWRLVTGLNQIHSTTCVAQDLRPGRAAVWYIGTGEFRGSTNNNTRWGALYRGDGIFKSVDNGLTWSILPSTQSGTPHTTDNFDYVWSLGVDPSNQAQDEIYAATYNGLYRSVDGGNGWTTQKTADSSYNDVAVTATGVVYAHTHESGATRIWRSPDGLTWTNIAPGTFPSVTGRVVIAPAPSQPNIVYFFVQGANTTPAVSGHQLWKYRYLSGDGSGNGGVWENRGGNLPGDINTQTGYDMIVHVSPVDTNLVIIGGTNLYRSTSGFSSTAATTTIGGYPYWPGGNHHPDLHGGMFKPGNPLVYYSSHDGGLSRTDDIGAASVSWTNLNNGYNVTQFYSVSIAPDSGSSIIMGGSQDNGTLLGVEPGVSSWTMVYGGDGTVVEVAPAVDDRLYTQYQGGQAQRMTRTGSGVVTITPSGATSLMFVNPIVLDPNNSSVLYYAGGRSSQGVTSGVWRNDDALNATTTAGWTMLTATNVGAASGYTRTVSAIGVSRANPANVVYYGTIDGIVKRIDSAQSAGYTVTDVTPPGLNGGTSIGGFVRCIAVDPRNAARALVAFGNYNFQSVWYTTDAGATWTDVEGNIAGLSGPSVRFAVIFHVGNTTQVFLGTSIGLLSTSVLNGSSTVWVQEASTVLGNVIVGYLDFRPADNTLAVGTHARGIWTGVFAGATAAQSPRSPTVFTLEQNYPNPFNPETKIRYILPAAGSVSLLVYDLTGQIVAEPARGVQEAGTHTVRFSGDDLPSGIYLVTLRTGSGSASRKMLLLK